MLCCLVLKDTREREWARTHLPLGTGFPFPAALKMELTGLFVGGREYRFLFVRSWPKRLFVGENSLKLHQANAQKFSASRLSVNLHVLLSHVQFTMASLVQNPQGFSHFSGLPVEIRLRIWQFAALRRPRVVQIGYDPYKGCWKAWQDGLGGLPSIALVSREAREEALKPYTRIFDAYVSLEEDTIFISDPIFSIRKPRSIFMSSEHAKRLRNVAFTSEIYNGLAQSFDQFPSLCEAPVTVLRKLEGLAHFTLALSEDGAGFEYSDDEEDGGEDEGENEDEDNEEAGGNEESTNQPHEVENIAALALAGESDTAQDDTVHEPRDEEESGGSLDEDAIVRRFLDRLDEEAIETMSKGYFRHLGNIHFESAVGHPDHWEAWETYRDGLEVSFAQEEEEFSAWIRPKASVMAVEYGLCRLGDFRRKLHLLGDHKDDVFDDVYETNADGYISETDDGIESESDISL